MTHPEYQIEVAKTVTFTLGGMSEDEAVDAAERLAPFEDPTSTTVVRRD